MPLSAFTEAAQRRSPLPSRRHRESEAHRPASTVNEQAIKSAINEPPIPEYLAPWYEPMHVAYTQESARIIGAPGMRLVAQTRIPAGKRGDHPLVTIRSELAWGDPAAETIVGAK